MRMQTEWNSFVHSFFFMSLNLSFASLSFFCCVQALKSSPIVEVVGEKLRRRDKWQTWVLPRHLAERNLQSGMCTLVSVPLGLPGTSTPTYIVPDSLHFDLET